MRCTAETLTPDIRSVPYSLIGGFGELSMIQKITIEKVHFFTVTFFGSWLKVLRVEIIRTCAIALCRDTIPFLPILPKFDQDPFLQVK